MQVEREEEGNTLKIQKKAELKKPKVWLQRVQKGLLMCEEKSVKGDQNLRNS